jgi:putative ABC transport system permease protein
LADVKAVTAGYPLRGAILLVDPANAAGKVAPGVPPPGEVWIDSRLAARLGVQQGSRLAVGESTLTVGAIVQQDPEVTSGLLALGPRLMMNLDDVAATRLLQPGNRASYRLLVAGDAINAFRDWAQTHLDRGQRLESIRDLRPEVRQTLERAEQYLGLAALVAVMLAAVAIALAASRYLRRHLDAAAMMRCLGAPQRQILSLFALQFLVLGVGASIAGCALALGGQQLLIVLLGGIVSADLPPPSAWPAFAAAASGLAVLFGFALPPLFALSRVPPLRVLRRDLGLPRAGGWLAYALGAATIALLIGWQAQDATTGAIMIGGTAALLFVSGAVAWALIALLRLLPQRGYSWRYGLSELRRRPLASSLQIGALAQPDGALAADALVRGDLLRNWRASLPADAPNVFLINILPDQIEGMHALLQRELKADVPLYPMVRGRLVAVNDVPVDSTRLTDARARRLAEREFNLSWMKELPRSNRVVAGQWWKAGETGVISSEDGIAETLGVKRATCSPTTSSARRVARAWRTCARSTGTAFVNFFAPTRRACSTVSADDLHRRNARRTTPRGSTDCWRSIRMCSQLTSASCCIRSAPSSSRSRAPSNSCFCSRLPAACWCSRRRSRRRRTSACTTRPCCAR